MNKEQNEKRPSTSLERVKREPFQKIKKRVESTLAPKKPQADARGPMTNERIDEFLNNHSLVTQLERFHLGSWLFLSALTVL